MKRYGLIGRTLGHSFSKQFFSKKFEDEGLSGYCYDNFELATIREFPSLLQKYKDLKGLNITIPYKEEVLPFLTKKNEVVARIGACNCIKLDGTEVIGYNTDVAGFRNSLEPQLKSQHNKALILGTGGASKAIAYALEQLHITYSFVSRRKGDTVYGYEDLNEAVVNDHLLIINTTPLGMSPSIEASPPINYNFITPQHFLFDIIYNPSKTKFLAEGEQKGAQICNGYEMLIKQAEESWKIWTE